MLDPIDAEIKGWQIGKSELLKKTDWVFRVSDKRPDIGHGTRGLGPIGHHIAEAARMDSICSYLRVTQSRQESRESNREVSPAPSWEKRRDLHKQRVNVLSRQTIAGVSQLRAQSRESMKAWQEGKVKKQEALKRFVGSERKETMKARRRRYAETEKVNQWMIEENITGKSTQKMLTMSRTEDKHDMVQAQRQRFIATKDHMIAGIMDELQKQHDMVAADKKKMRGWLVDLEKRNTEALKTQGDVVAHARGEHRRAITRAKEHRLEHLTKLRKEQKALLPVKVKSTTVREMLRPDM